MPCHEVAPYIPSLTLSRNTKTLPTPATLGNIRIPKHKPRAQLILYPIHLAPNDTEQRLTINQHLNAGLLYRFIEASRFIHVLQMIRETGAPPVLHPNPNEFGFGLVEQGV